MGNCPEGAKIKPLGGLKTFPGSFVFQSLRRQTFKGRLTRRQMKLVICLIIGVLLYGSNAWAGCKSDCRNEYDSEVESCKTQYDDPHDADELQTCMDNAKSEYDSCIHECEN